jgi:hypothetical protein
MLVCETLCSKSKRFTYEAVVKVFVWQADFAKEILFLAMTVLREAV